MLEIGESGKVVIGADFVRRNLLNQEITVGKTLQINGEDYRIVGILKPLGSPTDDASVYLNDKDARELLNIPERVDYIYVKVGSGEDPIVVADSIERALRRERNVEKGKEDFSVQTFNQLIDTFNIVFGIVQAVVLGIAGISLLVGGIGIMNTMYTAVLERTKEIGIMKAIGAKNSDVMLIFLIESGMLGTVGGAIGIVIGMGLGKLVEIGATQALGTAMLRAYFPLYLIVGTLLFSFIVGSVSGLFPAMQAARMEPVEALKKKY
jgi:putative ABC transport system permease protein